ncbi:hypothetical protein [Streptomyces anulatus]|nr:hypothetical protein OG536_25130 [Streptomyces anulatus]
MVEQEKGTARENITIGPPRTFDDDAVRDVVDAVSCPERLPEVPQYRSR